MKKFLALTLVLFLSFSTAGGQESIVVIPESAQKNSDEIINKGEVIGSTFDRESRKFKKGDYIETDAFRLLVRYKGNLYWCNAYQIATEGGTGWSFDYIHKCYWSFESNYIP